MMTILVTQTMNASTAADGKIPLCKHDSSTTKYLNQYPCLKVYRRKV